MKKVKLVILILILVFCGTIGYQNMGFLIVKHQFGLNLWFASYHTPEIQNGVLLLVFFMVGLLLAFISTLRSRWQSRRTIKALTSEVTESREKINALEKELAGLKVVPQTVEAVDEGTLVSS